MAATRNDICNMLAANLHRPTLCGGVEEFGVYKLGGKILAGTTPGGPVNHIPELSAALVSTLRPDGSRRQVCVVSAMGGTTEQLRTITETSGILPWGYIPDSDAHQHLITQIKAKYGELGALAFSRAWVETESQTPENNPIGQMPALDFAILNRAMFEWLKDVDAVIHMGEVLAAPILQGALHSRMIGANLNETRRVIGLTLRRTYFPIVTDFHPGNANILWLPTLERTFRMLGHYPNIYSFILPGFGGKSTGLGRHVYLTTLGKGGTDCTAAVVGLAVASILFWQEAFNRFGRTGKGLESLGIDELMEIRKKVPPVNLVFLKDTGAIWSGDPKEDTDAKIIKSVSMDQVGEILGIAQLLQGKARRALHEHWHPFLNFSVQVSSPKSLGTPGTIITGPTSDL